MFICQGMRCCHWWYLQRYASTVKENIYNQGETPLRSIVSTRDTIALNITLWYSDFRICMFLSIYAINTLCLALGGYVMNDNVKTSLDSAWQHEQKQNNEFIKWTAWNGKFIKWTAWMAKSVQLVTTLGTIIIVIKSISYKILESVNKWFLMDQYYTTRVLKLGWGTPTQTSQRSCDI